MRCNCRPSRALLVSAAYLAAHLSAIPTFALDPAGVKISRPPVLSGVDGLLAGEDRGLKIMEFGPPVANLGSACISSDGHRVACTYRKSSSRVWNAETGAEILSVPLTGAVGAARPSNLIAFDRRGHKVVIAGPAEVVHSGEMFRGHNVWRGTALEVWDVDRGRLLRTLGVLPDLPLRVALSRDGTRVGCVDESLNVKCWAADTGQELVSIQGPHGSHAKASLNWCCDFNQDVTRFAAGHQDGPLNAQACLLVCDLIKGQSRLVGPFRKEPTEYYVVVFRPDGRTVAALNLGHGAGNEYHLIDADSGKLKGRMDTVFDVASALSPTGKYLALGGVFGQLQIVATESRRIVQKSPGLCDPVHAIVFRDESTMRILSGGGGLKVDPATGGPMPTRLTVWDFAIDPQK